MIEANTKNEDFAIVLAEIMTRQDNGEAFDIQTAIGMYPQFRSEILDYFGAVEAIDKMSEPSTEHFNTMNSSDSETVGGTRVKPSPSTKGFADESFPIAFGRYQILRLLGQGGMGKVYLAKDSILGRRVALKIPEIPSNNDEFVKRFYREAQAAAAIQHPNICPVFDVGELDGIRFISMAFIEGKPLSDFTKAKNSQNPKAIAVMIRKVAIALHEAHKLGIIHRDLKPANIMIDKQGEPVIMDFGLARNVSLTDATQLTQEGAIVGTPAYMSPEQIRDNDKVAAASDIYSLGVIMYLMLTGKLPFEGDLVSIITQIIADSPRRPLEINATVNPVLESICLKAMEKVATDRYSSMIEMAHALNDFLRGQTKSTVNPDQSVTDHQSNETVVQREEIIAVPETVIRSNASKKLDLESEIDEQPVIATAPATAVTIQTQPKAPYAKTKMGAGRNSRTRWIAAAVAFGIVGFLSVVFLIPTKDGFIRVEIDDPEISAVLSSNGVTVKSGDDENLIKIEPGVLQSLKITRGDFEFETDDFVLGRGEKTVLKIDFIKGKMIATRDGDPLDLSAKKTTLMASKKLLANGPDQNGRPKPNVASMTRSPEKDGKLVRDLPWYERFFEPEMSGLYLEDGTKVKANDQLQGVRSNVTNVTNVDCLNLNDSDLSLLLSTFPNVKRLCINTDNVSSNGISAIAGTKIDTLLISFRKAPPSGEALAAIGQLTQLRDISAYGCFIDDDDLRHFSKLTSLRRLSLGSNDIKGPGLKHLEALQSLRELEIFCQPEIVSDDIAKMIGKLKGLRFVSFACKHDCDISQLDGLPLSELRLFVGKGPYIDLKPILTLPLERIAFIGSNDAWKKQEKVLRQHKTLKYINDESVDDAFVVEQKSDLKTGGLGNYLDRLKKQGVVLRNEDHLILEPSPQLAGTIMGLYPSENSAFSEQDLIFAFKHFENLQVLVLHENHELTYDSLKLFKGREISHVDIRMDFSNENAVHLLNFNRVKSLGVGIVTDQSMEYLGRLDQLERLNLNNNPITRNGLKSLASLHALNDLCLSNLKINARLC